MVQVEVTFPGQTSEYDKVMKKPSPRIIKTHLYFKFFTESVQKARSKFIVVSRDPKDVLASLFNQYRDVLNYTGSFNEFFEIYKNKELVFGDPFDHAISWWEHKDEDNFLFTTYEQMKTNIRGVIKGIAEFLNKELSDDVIEKIVDHTSFKKMKVNPMVNKAEVNENFIRKGEIGDWVNYMNEEQRALIDSTVKEVQEKYDIVF